MLAPRDLDRLLEDCMAINARLSPAGRLTLGRFLRLRERHGPRTIHYLDADDIELLEDWAAAEYRRDARQSVRPAARSATATDAESPVGRSRPRASERRDGDKTQGKLRAASI